MGDNGRHDHFSDPDLEERRAMHEPATSTLSTPLIAKLNDFFRREGIKVAFATEASTVNA